LIEKTIAEEMKKAEVPGLAVAIARNGRSETIKQMFTAQQLRDRKPTGSGLGWAVLSDEGARRIQHSGGSIGATQILIKYPDQGLIIAALVNCDHYSASQIKIRMAKILFEKNTTQ
jgi:hypothetical protein